jgi:hypothetical protein
MASRSRIYTPIWTCVKTSEFPVNKRTLRALKVAVFLLCLVPLFLLVLEALGFRGMSLGANPVEELLHRCGKWGLNFLLITLTITPLRRLTHWNWLIRLRRMLGLFAFFYILMHFLIYAGLDQSFTIAYIVEDIIERPYITPLHHAGNDRVVVAHTTGCDIDKCNDEKTGSTLAEAPSPGLRHTGTRSMAFLLAGEGGYAGAAHLCGHPRLVVNCSSGLLPKPESQATKRKD